MTTPPTTPLPSTEEQEHLEVQPAPPPPRPADVSAISHAGSLLGALALGAIGFALFGAPLAVPLALAGAVAGGALTGLIAAERAEAGPVARVVHTVQEAERAVEDAAAPPLKHVAEDEATPTPASLAMAAAAQHRKVE